MNRKLFLAMTLSVVSSFAVALGQAQTSSAANPVPAQTAEVGKKAPDFSLPDADGTKHSLADYKGKFVVLEWVNFGCPFVRKHYDSKNMQKLQSEYTGKGVVWLTICSSAKGKQGHLENDAIKKQLEKEGWKGTAYLIDESGAVGHEYGATATPNMFIMDKSHQLVYAGAIDDIKSTDVEDVAKAHNYVKATLDEVMTGKKIAAASNKPYGCSVKYSE
ncbi:MAG TPA: thioredoxin family protein [Oculatellaceae cyanobacterium]